MKYRAYLLAGLAAFALSACDEDFNEGITPTPVNTEAQPFSYVQGAVASVTPIDFANVTDDVEYIKVCDITAPEVGDSYRATYQLILNGTTTVEVNDTGAVAANELRQYVENTYGRRPEAHAISAVLRATVSNGSSATRYDSEAFNIVVTPTAPFIDDNGYYVVGNIDGWTCTRVDAYHMTNGGGDVYADPRFSVELKAVDDITTYEIKILPSSAFNEDGNVSNWDIALSALSGVDEAAHIGSFSYSNAGGNIKFDAVAEAKKYKITIDLLDGTYTVEALTAPELYMTGNELGWGGTWLQLHKVNSNWDDSGATENIFWFIRYFKAGEQFKFAPVADWNNDFGGSQMTVTDEAGAGYSDDGTNCKVENAGWYQIVVNATAKTLTISAPQVYICGEVVENGWSASIPDEANRFTNPTAEDGEFVSPAFVNDGNLRMFTLIQGVDWWRSEYNIFGTKVVIRTENDQDAVPVTAGQRAYVNFSNLQGRIQ